MNFETFSDFLTMGGHGAYVWAAWGIGLVTIIWNIASPLRSKVTTRAMLQEWIATDERRVAQASEKQQALEKETP